ncbi:hypothetical protein BsWGS_28662 [Bradybaena similaris]
MRRYICPIAGVAGGDRTIVTFVPLLGVGTELSLHLSHHWCCWGWRQNYCYICPVAGGWGQNYRYICPITGGTELPLNLSHHPITGGTELPLHLSQHPIAGGTLHLPHHPITGGTELPLNLSHHPIAGGTLHLSHRWCCWEFWKGLRPADHIALAMTYLN